MLNGFTGPSAYNTNNQEANGDTHKETNDSRFVRQSAEVIQLQIGH